jgi:uncharacterized repeat protein (TIGR01451 family)
LARRANFTAGRTRPRAEPGLRRASALLAAVIGLTGLIQGAVYAAELSPVSGLLPRIAALTALDLSPDRFDRIAPLRADFVRSQLGDAFGAFALARPRPGLDLFGSLPDQAPRGGDFRPSRPPVPDSTTSTTYGLRSDPILPIGDVEPGHLVVAMRANRTTAHAADAIVYTVTVTNAGAQAFDGDASVRSHVPQGTTEQAPTECGGGSLPTNTGEACHQVVVPVPGSANPNVHQVNHSFSFTKANPLAKGASVSFDFVVTVDPGNTVGTVIENHAHLTYLSEPEQTSDTVRVTVQ